MLALLILVRTLDRRLRMDVRRELRDLERDPEIVVSVTFLRRGLCQAAIGDITNGYRQIGELDSFDAAVEWLHERALSDYPNSQYVNSLMALKR